MENQEKKTTEISIGTAYEINKNLVQKYEKKLTPQKLRIAKEEIAKYIKETDNRYYMLLCHERRDYTVFTILDGDIDEKGAAAAHEVVDEVIYTRGEVRGIDYIKETAAYEIWISIDDESFCYYFFPYDNAVVEV